MKFPKIALTNSKISKFSSRRNQAGFTLIELGVVSIILVVLVAIAVPAIRTEIIKGRVSSAGQDLTKAIVQLKGAAAVTASATPYASVGTVDKFFGGTSYRISGSTVLHDLGTTGGAVVMTTLGSGVAVSTTVWGVAPAACASLANTISKSADAVEVGQGGTATVPAAPAAPTTVPTATSANVVKIPGGTFDAAAAAAACSTTGENNFIRIYTTV